MLGGGVAAATVLPQAIPWWYKKGFTGSGWGRDNFKAAGGVKVGTKWQMPKRSYNGRRPYRKYRVPKAYQKNMPGTAWGAGAPGSLTNAATVRAAAGSFYQGRVKGVNRKRAANRVSVNDTRGYRIEQEQFGSVTGGGNVLRVGFKAMPMDETLIGLFIVIVRYLLKKHYNFVYTGPDALVNRYNFTGSGITYGRPYQLIIDFGTYTGGGVSKQLQAIITNASTVRTIAKDLAVQYLNHFPNNVGLKDQYWPQYYQFEDQYNTAAGQEAIGERSPRLPMSGIKVSMYGKAQVVIQNTSIPDTGTSTGIGFVDNNPICGKVCYIKGQTVVPKIKGIEGSSYSGYCGLEAVTGKDGVLFPYGAIEPEWKAIQGVSVFRNGIREINGISLDPGASQSFDVYFKYYGDLSTWFAKYWPDSYNNGTTDVEHRGSAERFGGLNMIGLLQLEKRISTGVNPIRINYHVDFHLGMRIVRGPLSPQWNVDYAERNVNYTTPS